MNKLDVNQVGGFPLTTRILDELQKISAVFNGLGGVAGDKTILYGCEVTGATMSNGIVYLNGEVFEFRGGIVQSKVIIKEDKENLVFENNESKTVIRTRYVTFGSGVGAMEWTDFVKPFQTRELEEVLGLITLKLGGIESGAQKNVQADWEETNDTKSSFIKNKPDISDPFLHKGKYDFGDVFDEDSLLVTFPDVGTSDYIVAGGLVGKNADFTQDANVYSQTREHTSTSFRLVLTEQAGGRFQDLSFYFALIPF